MKKIYYIILFTILFGFFNYTYSYTQEEIDNIDMDGISISSGYSSEGEDNDTGDSHNNCYQDRNYYNDIYSSYHRSACFYNSDKNKYHYLICDDGNKCDLENIFSSISITPPVSIDPFYLLNIKQVNKNSDGTLNFNISGYQDIKKLQICYPNNGGCANRFNESNIIFSEKSFTYKMPRAVVNKYNGKTLILKEGDNKVNFKIQIDSSSPVIPTPFPPVTSNPIIDPNQDLLWLPVPNATNTCSNIGSFYKNGEDLYKCSGTNKLEKQDKINCSQYNNFKAYGVCVESDINKKPCFSSNPISNFYTCKSIDENGNSSSSSGSATGIGIVSNNLVWDKRVYEDCSVSKFVDQNVGRSGKQGCKVVGLRCTKSDGIYECKEGGKGNLDILEKVTLQNTCNSVVQNGICQKKGDMCFNNNTYYGCENEEKKFSDEKSMGYDSSTGNESFYSESASKAAHFKTTLKEDLEIAKTQKYCSSGKIIMTDVGHGMGYYDIRSGNEPGSGQSEHLDMKIMKGIGGTFVFKFTTMGAGSYGQIGRTGHYYMHAVTSLGISETPCDMDTNLERVGNTTEGGFDFYVLNSIDDIKEKKSNNVYLKPYTTYYVTVDFSTSISENTCNDNLGTLGACGITFQIKNGYSIIGKQSLALPFEPTLPLPSIYSRSSMTDPLLKFSKENLKCGKGNSSNDICAAQEVYNNSTNSIPRDDGGNTGGNNEKGVRKKQEGIYNDFPPYVKNKCSSNSEGKSCIGVGNQCSPGTGSGQLIFICESKVSSYTSGTKSDGSFEWQCSTDGNYKLPLLNSSGKSNGWVDQKDGKGCYHRVLQGKTKEGYDWECSPKSQENSNGYTATGWGFAGDIDGISGKLSCWHKKL